MKIAHRGEEGHHMTDFTGTIGNDIFDGGAGNDNFFMQQGGSDDVEGGGGNDGFYFGATLTYKDLVTGGAGVDTIAIQGNYGPPVGEPRWEIPGPILFGVREIEVVLLLSGSDPSFGDTGGNLYDYEVGTVDANVSAAENLVIQATGLLPGEDLRFDGSAETSGRFSVFAGRGNDVLIGGAGNDGFLFGDDGSFTGADLVRGNGGNDSIALRGNYVGANAVVLPEQERLNPNIFVENLVFLSGLSTEFGGTIVPGGFDYDVTLAAKNGELKTINGSSLKAGETMRVDGTAIGDDNFYWISQIFGGPNDDIILGGFAQALGGGGGDQITSFFLSGTINGGAGDDLITILNSNVFRIFHIVEGGDGSDTLRLGNRNIVDLDFTDMTGLETLEILTAGTHQLRTEAFQSGIRTIVDSSAGANVIDASQMRGETAILTFDGGDGADQIRVGGVASNVLLYDALSDSSGTEQDVISGFVSGLDKVDARAVDTPAPLTAIEFKGNASGLAAAQALLEAGDGNLDAVFDSDSNTLWFNLDDNGVLDANDLSIILFEVTSLQGADVLDGQLLI
jgi:hypothetical protein